MAHGQASPIDLGKSLELTNLCDEPPPSKYLCRASTTCCCCCCIESRYILCVWAATGPAAFSIPWEKCSTGMRDALHISRAHRCLAANTALHCATHPACNECATSSYVANTSAPTFQSGFVMKHFKCFCQDCLYFFFYIWWLHSLLPVGWHL